MPHSRFSPAGPLLILTLAIPACSDPSSCDICTTSAVVYGTVRRPNGAAVAGAPVHIGIFRDTCDSGDVEVPGDPGLTTGSDGSYRTQTVALTGEFTACVSVNVQEPGSAIEDPGVAASALVDFLPDFGTGQRRDSVRIDVELPVPVVPLQP